MKKITTEGLKALDKLKKELYYSPDQIPDIDKYHEAIEKDLIRLAAYDAVLASSRRYTIPHPEDPNWVVSDALDTLACNSSYTANDIGKFPLKDLYESEEKLAKLEDIYDDYKHDCVKELEKICINKKIKKEEDN